MLFIEQEWNYVSVQGVRPAASCIINYVDFSHKTTKTFVNERKLF